MAFAPATDIHGYELSVYLTDDGVAEDMQAMWAAADDMGNLLSLLQALQQVTLWDWSVYLPWVRSLQLCIAPLGMLDHPTEFQMLAT